MTDKPQHIGDYDDTRTELAEKVLLEVWGRLGEFHDFLVLVGGLVPRYLIPQSPKSGHAPPAHCGTMDVDLGISLAVADAETYETIRVTLTDRLGFEPGLNQEGREQRHSFVKTVSGIPLNIDFLTTEYDGPTSVIRKVQRSLSAIQVEGLGLALNDPLRVTIQGSTLAGAKTVETVSVCRPVPFAILKALAFEKRREPKDAYDLVYLLRYYQDGPSSVAAAATNDEQQAASFRHALDSLTVRFQSPDHDGPFTYASFLANEEGAAIQAYAAVQEFLGAFRG